MKYRDQVLLGGWQGCRGCHLNQDNSTLQSAQLGSRRVPGP
ncbi:hypothetical protein L810_8322 [Burkholderia sp. AU4i]|nr:hypothetical protein L810_8322 [Burkholderia sp. AU4i]